MRGRLHLRRCRPVLPVVSVVVNRVEPGRTYSRSNGGRVISVRNQIVNTPAKRVFRLTKSERDQIFRATKFVVKHALATTGNDFSDPPEDWLIHQKWKREGVCPKHGTPLRHATIGGRSTVWCAKCQK